LKKREQEIEIQTVPVHLEAHKKKKKGKEQDGGTKLHWSIQITSYISFELFAD
jgi:hypothetical protein